MKGIVFTEFFSLVEKEWSADMVEDLIDDTNPASGGAYTAVGTYDHGELVAMVMALSKRVDIPPQTLIRVFGKHLFDVFVTNYGHFFSSVTDPFDFLESVESYIHVEVRKLYPDAELPSFESERPDATSLKLTYRSGRHFADLAYGLIDACCAHWKVPVRIDMADRSGDSGADVLFTITRAD
jgi:hypothetical protein